MFWHDRESVGVRMERAVLLSDIEFLDGVHESDWERIEEDSFLVNVSTPLNENQQVVLEYLKSEITRDGGAPILNFSAFGWKHFGERLPKNVSEAYKEMDGSQDLQVLAAFAEWGMKEVAE